MASSGSLQQRRVGRIASRSGRSPWGANAPRRVAASARTGRARCRPATGCPATAVSAVRVALADGQLDVALQPLQVGHLRDVAEVRLGGVGHRRDDLVAALGDRVGVTGDLVEQPAAARGGVVDLVDVRTELAAAGSHAALGFSGADPLVGALRLDQHPLDRRRRGGLQRRHRRGADQDAVDRHQREAVRLRPAPGQVFGRPLGRADAAADADGDVGPRPQFRIRGQQQVVEVFPGVVATGAPALDVHDHRLGGHLGRDADDRADLLDGARLEHDVADADVVELVDQLDGILEVGDAGADRPGRRSPRRTDGPSAPAACHRPAASTGRGRGTAR